MDRRRFITQSGQAAAVLATARIWAGQTRSRPPNFIFIFTDDQRHDAMGCAGNPFVVTPNIDSLAARGVRFANAFVTTSVCSASRACVLTGRYGSANGVKGLATGLNPDEKTIVDYLKAAGYYTGYAGKWHLKNPPTPEAAGFDVSTYFYSNGSHYDRKVVENGKPALTKGFIEDYLAAKSIEFLESASRRKAPFFFHLCTQVPHMDHKFEWPADPAIRARYDEKRIPIPANYDDDLAGKPPYLRTGRHRVRAMETYGYKDPAAIRKHFCDYYAEITQLDAALGKLLAALKRLRLEKKTYIFFMGDNGWFMGEHGFTSKLLPYEESIRVPFIVAGPRIKEAVRREFTLNADIPATILDLAGLTIPDNMHGRSVLPLLHGEATNWRQSILYEALEPQLGSHPLVAVRTQRWKYIQTFAPKDTSKVEFEELYDMQSDPGELNNLAGSPEHDMALKAMRSELARLRRGIE